MLELNFGATNDAGGDDDLAASELSKEELVVHRLVFRPELESKVKLSTKPAVWLEGSNQMPSAAYKEPDVKLAKLLAVQDAVKLGHDRPCEPSPV